MNDEPLPLWERVAVQLHAAEAELAALQQRIEEVADWFAHTGAYLVGVEVAQVIRAALAGAAPTLPEPEPTSAELEQIMRGDQ